HDSQHYCPTRRSSDLPGSAAGAREDTLKLAYISHPSSLDHEMGACHPESPERSTVIADRLLLRGTLDFVSSLEAPMASDEQILRDRKSTRLNSSHVKI